MLSRIDHRILSRIRHFPEFLQGKNDIPQSQVLSQQKRSMTSRIFQTQNKDKLLSFSQDINPSSSFSIPHRNFSCWKCSTKLNLESKTKTGLMVFPLKCSKCSSLQPQPKDQPLPNYFEIFGLDPRKYKMSLPEVSAGAKQLQRQLHPDLFTGKEQIERDLSADLSSLVNKALKTLQDPIERGQYFLQLKGVEVDLERQAQTNPTFLADVMELNERLDEVRTPQEWKDFRDENDRKLQSYEKELESAFDTDDLKQAQLILNKMKFYESLQTRLKQLQFKIGVVE